MGNNSVSASVRWNLLGSVFKSGSAFVINVVLARLLGPEPFGIIAVVSIFISIGNLIIDSGLTSGLVQKKYISEKDITFTFTIQIFTAVVIFVLYVICAPFLANFYKQPLLVPVFILLSLSMLLQAAGQTSTALLKRGLFFDRIQIAQIFSFVIYTAVGLPMAISGFGVWSLVFAQLANSFSYLVVIYFFERHSISLNLIDPGNLGKFGFKVLGGNIANFTISNFDNSVISVIYGVTNLGLYSRAWNLVYMPVSIFVGSIQSVLFSSISKIQDKTEDIKVIFLRLLTLIGQVMFPYSVFVVLESENIISILYGDKWINASPYLSILALAMPFFSLMAIQGPVLLGVGKPHIELKAQWITVCFMLVVVFIARHQPLKIFVISVLIVYIFRFCLMTFSSCKALGIRYFDMLKSLVYMILLSVIVSGSMVVLHVLGNDMPLALRIIVEGVLLLFGETLLLFIAWTKWLPKEEKTLLKKYFISSDTKPFQELQRPLPQT